MIPHTQVPMRLEELEPYRNRPILSICYQGVRSRFACEVLAQAGFTKLYNVNGGMMEWYDQKLPVVPGQPLPQAPV